MTRLPVGEPVVVAIDRASSASLAEARYALRTLLRTAGFATRFTWYDDRMACDVYYGPRPPPDVAARVTIPAVAWPFSSAPEREPTASTTALGLPFLLFAGESATHPRDDSEHLVFPTDVVFAAYWLLTGAVEPTYPRSRFDDLDLDASVLVRDGLLARPLVSLYAAKLRQTLDTSGTRATPWAWEGDRTRIGFAFTHDVDYPEIIRPIEVLRLLKSRGLGGIALAKRVVTGESHFWTFAEWVRLTARYGTRPSFYFMARRGSLLQYAMGTPDDFYDVRSPRFQRLFAELKDAGCEIGLHASFHSHRSAETLRREVQRIAEAAGVECAGNRHHYWHLDPAAPNETLRRHGEAGLTYDSSLGLEYYPGFRRGICHPYRVFHSGIGRELPTVQLPPAWMDDHFDRRLAKNQIVDREGAARALLQVARDTRGVVIVDYHSRGMNADFYPQYGPWLTRFAESNFDQTVRGMTPGEMCEAFLERERALDSASTDDTLPHAASPIASQLVAPAMVAPQLVAPTSAAPPTSPPA